MTEDKIKKLARLLFQAMIVESLTRDRDSVIAERSAEVLLKLIITEYTMNEVLVARVKNRLCASTCFIGFPKIIDLLR